MQKIIFEQILPLSIEECWNFFSTPKNLNEITPNDLTFKITSIVPPKIYEGLFITYKVSPLLNIPLNWVTEITHINEPHYFIDEQRSGPYKIWHHEHHFEKVSQGTKMRDIVYYEVGYGFLGEILEFLFVNKKVKSIFTYRQQKLNQLFSK